MSILNMIVILAVAVVLLRSLLGSVWAFFAEKRLRQFLKAQHTANKLARGSKLRNPRDRQT